MPWPWVNHFAATPQPILWPNQSNGSRCANVQPESGEVHGRHWIQSYYNKETMHVLQRKSIDWTAIEDIDLKWKATFPYLEDDIIAIVSLWVFLPYVLLPLCKMLTGVHGSNDRTRLGSDIWEIRNKRKQQKTLFIRNTRFSLFLGYVYSKYILNTVYYIYTYKVHI